jgi:hypothetical protein
MKQRQETIPDYVKELVRLFDAGKLRRGEVALIEVEHFDFCSFWIDGRCDCSPTIRNRESGELLNPVTD